MTENQADEGKSVFTLHLGSSRAASRRYAGMFRSHLCSFLVIAYFRYKQQQTI
jgi:hypothetical protein